MWQKIKTFCFYSFWIIVIGNIGFGVTKELTKSKTEIDSVATPLVETEASDNDQTVMVASANDKPEITVTVQKMVGEHRENQLRAERKYSGKLVKVIGFFYNAELETDGSFKVYLVDPLSSSTVITIHNANDEEQILNLTNGNLAYALCRELSTPGTIPTFDSCTGVGKVDTAGQRSDFFYVDLIFQEEQADVSSAPQ